jgi:hypothetical protein
MGLGLYMTLLTSFVCQLSHACLSSIVWMDWPESPSIGQNNCDGLTRDLFLVWAAIIAGITLDY